MIKQRNRHVCHSTFKRGPKYLTFYFIFVVVAILIFYMNVVRQVNNQKPQKHQIFQTSYQSLLLFMLLVFHIKNVWCINYLMNPLNIVHFRWEAVYNWRNWETLYHDLSVRKSHQNVPSFRELPLTGSFLEEWCQRNTDSVTYNWRTEPGVCNTVMIHC